MERVQMKKFSECTNVRALVHKEPLNVMSGHHTKGDSLPPSSRIRTSATMATLDTIAMCCGAEMLAIMCAADFEAKLRENLHDGNLDSNNKPMSVTLPTTTSPGSENESIPVPWLFEDVPITDPTQLRDSLCPDGIRLE